MEIEIICQLLLATFLGALIGLEREYKRKRAGLQTCSLVALGTCLFTIIPFELNLNFDPTGIISAITIGMGFIGAGAVFHQPSGTVGLTTAAGLWAVSAIGVAVGFKFYSLAIFTTFLTLLVLSGFGLLEEKIFKK